MANILGIFTAIILAVAAFVAMKNKARLEGEIEARKTKEAVLAQTQGELVAAQETLNRLPEERLALEDQDVAKKAEEEKLKEEVDTLKAEIDTKTAEIAKNKEELADKPDDGLVDNQVEGKQLSIDEIAALLPKLKENRLLLEEISQATADKEASLANLTSQASSLQVEAARRKEEIDALSKGESLPSLSTSIRSIYPTWGFVTLNAGNNAGVTANSTLDVVRDGQTIARLLVTGVETRSASASIIPDSKTEEVSLMIGDRVIPSAKGKKAPAN